jgi:hypothetical protein
MLPHLLRSDCLHAPAAPRLATCKPHRLLQPRAQPSQPTAHTIHAHPAFASTREQHKPSRCTQCTAEVQRRQLRHPSETRCQRRCPSCVDLIVCTRRRPSARPSQAPPPATAPRTTAPAHSTHHHQRIAGIRKHPRTVPAAADARSVQLRFSDVSCVILPRLGASDAAAATSI